MPMKGPASLVVSDEDKDKNEDYYIHWTCAACSQMNPNLISLKSDFFRPNVALIVFSVCKISKYVLELW